MATETPPPSKAQAQLPSSEEFADVQQSAEFGDLRRSYRSFAFPLTVAFIAWYLLYVLLSAFGRGFMDTKVVGHLNVAFFFGLLQFVSTFLIALVYSRYANRRLDPLAGEIRGDLGDRR